MSNPATATKVQLDHGKPDLVLVVAPAKKDILRRMDASFLVFAAYHAHYFPQLPR